MISSSQGDAEYHRLQRRLKILQEAGIDPDRKISGFKFTNNKTKKPYLVIGEAVNTTNRDDGQIMILYSDFQKDSKIYAREKLEFLEKFSKQQDEERVVG